MATTTKTETISKETASYGKQLNLEDFVVQNTTWRELLIDLVQTNQLDPWNVDLAKVVDSYVAVVKQAKVLDLHLPANIILAASILLRLKSESFKVFEIIEEPIPEEIAVGERIIPNVDPLVPRSRLQPNRKVTLMELMQALEEVIQIKDRRDHFAAEVPAPLQFFIKKEDIDQKIEIAYNLLKENMDNTGLTTFAQVANRYTNSDSILLDLFIPLLFLATKERVTMQQDKFFDEIFIKLNKQSEGKQHG